MENIFIAKLFIVALNITLVFTSKRVVRLADLAENAAPREFPYFASIQVSGEHICGGSLISRTHVLTAAHCVRDLVAEPLYPVRQTNDIIIEVRTNIIGQGVKHFVRRLSYHRYYVDGRESTIFYPNDIAMITLLEPVTLTETVKIISLVKNKLELHTDTKVKLCGFGNSVVDGPTSPILRKTELFLEPHRECDYYFMTAVGKRIIPRYHTCAKRGYFYGACQGDSGGPLTYDGTLIGLVSGGNGVCESGEANVFTRVSSYLDYIEYEMNYDFESGQESSILAIGKDFSDDQNAMIPSLQFPLPFELVDPIQRQFFPEFSQIPSEVVLQEYPFLPPYVDPVTHFIYYT